MIRIPHRYGRPIRFLLVGGAVTMVYSGLVAALLGLAVTTDRAGASLIASVVTIPLSFLVHRRITYRDAAPHADQWPRFATTGLVNLFVNLAVMRGSQALHWPLWIGLMLGWVLVPAMNYLANAIWVFRVRLLAIGAVTIGAVSLAISGLSADGVRSPAGRDPIQALRFNLHHGPPRHAPHVMAPAS